LRILAVRQIASAVGEYRNIDLRTLMIKKYIFVSFDKIHFCIFL